MMTHLNRKKTKIIVIAIILIVIAVIITVLVRHAHKNQSDFPNTAGMAGVTVQMIEVRDSGLNGMAVITPKGRYASQVAIQMTGAPSGTRETASIYTGSCELIGGNAYLLNDLVNGLSTTTIEVSLSELLGQQLPLAINIQDTSESATSTACGDIEIPR
jgi:hypothetical protein